MTHHVTQLLIAWSGGNEAALGELMPLVYDELRHLARHYMRREGSGHTLQTTGLVNEAYLSCALRWLGRSAEGGAPREFMPATCSSFSPA